MESKREFKQLTEEDRFTLQSCIHNEKTFAQMAQRLKVHKTTIIREIIRNRVIKNGTTGGFCGYRNKKLVCNACLKKNHCHLLKYFYNHKHASQETEERRSTTRSKIHVSSELLNLANDVLVKAIVRQKQSLHDAYLANEELSLLGTELTIRNLIYKGLFEVKRHHLRNYVIYKHDDNLPTKPTMPYNMKILLNRAYHDYKAHKQENPHLNVVEFDSLIGKASDENAILTITFPKYGFQFGKLIRRGNSDDVYNTIIHLFTALGPTLVKTIFPINISDNDTEFSRFSEIETDSITGEVLCNTYYTRPNRATDKAACERLHRMARYLFPKSHAFDGLTQAMINEGYSHLNSKARSSLGDRTPYDLVYDAFGESFLHLINIHKIPLKKVRLYPLI